MIDNCELMKHMNAGMYVASSHKSRLKFQLLDVLSRGSEKLVRPRVSR